MEKALAVLWSPKSLLDFLWYYEAYGKEKYEYDLLIIPAGMDSDGKWSVKIYDFAKNSGIFNKISVYDGTYIDKGIWIKIKTIIDMGWNAIWGHQARYCAKVLKPWFNYKEYKQIVTIFLPTIFSGELLVLSKYLEVVLLEDGARDYEQHRRWPTKYWLKTEGIQYEIAGCILSKLGYADPTTMYTFAPTKKCVKFSSFPEQMKYLDYKCILKLNDLSKVSKDSYYNLVKKTFQFDLVGDEPDGILFTAALTDNFGIDGIVAERVVNYLKKKLPDGKFWIKKHPRDEMQYDFGNDDKVVEIPKNIPAELLVDNLKETKIYCMYPSTILQFLNDGKHQITILFDSQLENDQYSRQRILDAMKTINIAENCLLDINEGE